MGAASPVRIKDLMALNIHSLISGLLITLPSLGMLSTGI
jgi:hypothetical protein